MSSLMACRRIPRFVAGCIAITSATTPVAAKAPPQQAQLTNQEAEFLRQLAAVFAECKRDPSPDYCVPYRPLIEHMAESPLASEATGPVDEASSAVNMEVGTHNADVNRTVDGHVPGQTASTLPPNGGGVDVSFAAKSDTKTASLSLDVDLGDKVRTTTDNHVVDRSSSLSIIAQAPVGQDQAYQNLATLDGLTKASSIGFQYNLLRVGSQNHAITINDPAYQAQCQQLLREAMASDSKLDTASNQNYLKPYSCHAGTIHDLVDADTNIPVDARKSLTDALGELDKLDTPIVTSVVLLGLNGKIGYEQHSFYDGQSLAKSTVDRFPFQLGVSGTYLFNNRTSFTLSYAFQHSFKDGDSGQTQTLCPPTGSPNLKCITGYIGEPKLQTKHLLAGDLRYITPVGLLPIPIGIDPTATYDVRSRTYGFQFPVYFVVDAAKYLTAGIRWDWTSEKKKSVFGIFVASAFCVYPGKSSCESSGDSAK